MTTPTKQAETRSQLRNLMAQHTAATYAKPAVKPAAAEVPAVAARPAPTAPVPSAPRSLQTFGRYTVRLPKVEAAALDALILDAHMRLGKRVTVTDIFRIGLSRLGNHAPITADELSTLLSRDQRRSHTEG